MKPGRFIVRRGFMFHGEPCAPGTVVELSDTGLIGQLATLGKIAPADTDTERRLGHRETVEWSTSAPLRQNPPTPWLPVSGPGDLRGAGRRN